MSLTNILQFLQMEQRTCVIEVISDQNSKGWFYFSDGVIFDARFGELDGDQAAIEMISWDNVKIVFLPVNEHEIARRIDTDLASLIVRASNQRWEGIEALEEHESEVLKQEIDRVFSNTINLEDHVIYPGEGSQTEHENEKESGMDVQKLNQAIEIQKKDLGEGLLATDIFAKADGQSVTGYNSNPQACALFNKMTGDLHDSLVGSGFPGLGKYYILDLVDNMMVVVIPLGDYQWGMLINTKKVQLGLLLNVVMPKMIDAFEESITG